MWPWSCVLCCLSPSGDLPGQRDLVGEREGSRSAGRGRAEGVWGLGSFAWGGGERGSKVLRRQELREFWS